MIKTISYSYLHLLTCPYAAFLRYDAKIKGPTTPWLALGNGVHKGLEDGFVDDDFSFSVATKSFLEEFARILEVDEVFITWPQTKKLEAEGVEMIGRFNEQVISGYIPKKPMALEQEFRIPFEGIEIIGRIDRFDDEPDEEYSISDYKTGKAKPDEWFLRHDVQLTSYAWAGLIIKGKLPKKLFYHQLRTGEKMETVRTMQDIADLEVMLHNAIVMNQNGIRHRVFHDKVCGQCEYSGFAKMGGIRPQSPICDDHMLEIETVERLGLK